MGKLSTQQIQESWVESNYLPGIVQGQCLLRIFCAQYTSKMCYKDTKSVNTHFCRKLNEIQIHAFSHATWVTKTLFP